MDLHHGGAVRIVGSPRRLVRRVAAVLAALVSVSAFAIVVPATAVQPGSHGATVVRATPLTNTPHVLDGYVATFAELGGDIVVVGGNFTRVRTAASTTEIPRSHIFAFNKSTGAITSFAPALNGEVFSMLPTGDGQTVWVAGGFSTVNGQTVRSLVKLNVTTGQRVTQFNPPAFDGRIHDIMLRGNRLYATGRFTTVANQPHTSLAAVNPTTGALDPAVKIVFSDPRNGGALSILSADVSPDGSRLVAVGNFTKIAGQTRYQIGMIDLTTDPVSVANWSTNQYGNGCSASFESYMRDIEISPDGTFFVVVTTGAYSSQYLCDTAARWEIGATGTNLLPSWVNYTGGDALTEVAITDAAVYLGGHQRAANNNYVADKIGPGAVQRTGLGAVDIRSGAPLNWNPGRTRGYGVYGFLATDAGLWIGSDTDRISGYQYRGRMAFMPTAGGTSMPSEYVGDLPGKVYLVGPTSPVGVNPDSVITRDFDGTTPAPALQCRRPCVPGWRTISRRMTNGSPTGWASSPAGAGDGAGTERSDRARRGSRPPSRKSRWSGQGRDAGATRCGGVRRRGGRRRSHPDEGASGGRSWHLLRRHVGVPAVPDRGQAGHQHEPGLLHLPLSFLGRARADPRLPANCVWSGAWRLLAHVGSDVRRSALAD